MKDIENNLHHLLRQVEFKALYSWNGLRVFCVPFIHGSRVEGPRKAILEAHSLGQRNCNCTSAATINEISSTRAWVACRWSMVINATKYTSALIFGSFYQEKEHANNELKITILQCDTQ